MTAASARRWGGVALALGWCALFIPLRFPGGADGGYAEWAFHVLLFGGLARWGEGIVPPGKRHWAWVGVLVLAAASEGAQPLVGRSAEWRDVLAGWTGVVWMTTVRRWRRRSIAWSGLIALAMGPIIAGAGLRVAEYRDYPVLAHSGRAWSRHGWTLAGVALRREADGAFRVERREGDRGEAEDYPGLFRRPARSNWSSGGALVGRLFWPAEAPAHFALRVDDRSGHPPYGERFQREFLAERGWNDIRIPRKEWERTSGGRLLDVAAVRAWGVFLVSDPAFDYFLLEPIRLETE